jgi:hypothetical protein
MLAIVNPLTEMKAVNSTASLAATRRRVRDTFRTNVGKSQQPENVSNGLAHGDSCAAHVLEMDRLESPGRKRDTRLSKACRMEQHLSANVVEGKGQDVREGGSSPVSVFSIRQECPNTSRSVAARSLINQRIEDGLCSRGRLTPYLFSRIGQVKISELLRTFGL